MAIPPFLPPEIPWLFDALCGQEWPAGDEDALRRCAQAWDDALKSVADLAGIGNDTSLGVLSTVASMSADQFAQYWSQYTGGGVNDSALGQLAAQCQSMASALDGQATEVEYTKLSIDVTIVLTAIQILIAIAAALVSLGGSLAEVPVLVFLSRLTVQGLVGRFIQMVLMMMLPDLIAQGWMLAVDHTETSWNGSKTGSAAENAIAGGVLGMALGGLTGKLLGFLPEDFAKGIGGKAATGLAHIAEGGLTMDATALATTGINLGLAELSGDKQAIQQAQQQWQQQVSPGNLWHQFASGAMLATTFYLPETIKREGPQVSFTASDGKGHSVILDDKTREYFKVNGTFPDGFKAPAFDQSGRVVGAATFNGPDVSISRAFSEPLSADLTSQPGNQGGFQVTHGGTTERWGYPPSGTDHGPTVDGSVVPDNPAHTDNPAQANRPASRSEQPKAQLLTYSKPSDGTVPMPDVLGIPNASDTVPKGSVVHYTAGDNPQVYRVDLIDPKSGTVLVAQTDAPGGPLQLTGRTQFDYGPAGVGKLLGIQGATYYAHNGGVDGIPVASSGALNGKLSYPDYANRGLPPDSAARLYQYAFGDHYAPLATTTTAPAHAAAADGFLPVPTTEAQSTAPTADVSVDSMQAPGRGQSSPEAHAQSEQPPVLVVDANAALVAQGFQTSDPVSHVTAAQGHPVGGEGHAGPEITMHGESPIGHGPGLGGQHPVPEGLTPLDPLPGSGLEHLQGRLFRSEAGLVLYDGHDYRMLEAASHVHGDGISFIVDMHAVDGIPQAGTRGEMTPKQFVDLLQAGGWDGQQRVVLLACDTGGRDSFAAQVAVEIAARADLHPVEVIAADTSVWQSTHDSQLYLYGKTWDAEHKMWVPDQGSPGHWLSHQIQEDGTVAVREVPSDKLGMLATSDPKTRDATSLVAHDESVLAGDGSAHSPPGAGAAAGTTVFRGDPLGLPDLAIEDLPEDVVAYRYTTTLTVQTDAEGRTRYALEGKEGTYGTPEEARRAAATELARQLRERARTEGVPKELAETYLRTRAEHEGISPDLVDDILEQDPLAAQEVLRKVVSASRADYHDENRLAARAHDQEQAALSRAETAEREAARRAQRADSPEGRAASMNREALREEEQAASLRERATSFNEQAASMHEEAARQDQALREARTPLDRTRAARAKEQAIQEARASAETAAELTQEASEHEEAAQEAWQKAREARQEAQGFRAEEAAASERASELRQEATSHGREASDHKRKAAEIARDLPVFSNTQRNDLPLTAATLDVGGELIIATNAKGSGQVELHPVVKELYESVKADITDQIAKIDAEHRVVTDATGKDEPAKKRDTLVDELKQNGRCAEAMALSEWAKRADQRLQESESNLTQSQRNQKILDALKQAHASSIAIEIDYAGEQGGDQPGQVKEEFEVKEACVNCAGAFHETGITDLADRFVFRGDSAPPPEDPRAGVPSNMAGTAGGNERELDARHRFENADALAQDTPDPRMQRRVGQGAQEGNAGVEPSKIASALNPPQDWVARGGSADPPAALPPDGQQHGDSLEFPKRIGPAELARRMPEFLRQQHQAESELASLHQAIDAVEAGLGHATVDKAGGVPGADARVASLQRQLDDLNHRAQDLRKDLNAFTKDLWDKRGRFGQRPGAREMEAVNPELLHRRNVQRIYAKSHGLTGPAWAGEPSVVPGAELLRDAQVLARREVPMMERVKRLVSLHGALEEAVRDGQITPLLPDGLRKQIDAFRGFEALKDVNSALLPERIAALRDRIQQLPEYQRLDPHMRAYVDRLTGEIHGEAQGLLAASGDQGTGQATLPAPTDHGASRSLPDRLRQAATHPLNAMTQNVTGRLAYELLRTPEGGVYVRLSRLIDAFGLEENQFGAVRMTMVNLNLAEWPLAHAGPVDLGVVAGLSMKYALTHGVEFKQPLDRGDAIAIKIAGPGERVIVTSWDRMPVDKQGQPLVSTDVKPVDKHTIKTDLKVSPAVFLPGNKVELPAEAKLSLEVTAAPRPDGHVQWKVQGTAELVAQSPDLRKSGISALMGWLKGIGYPSSGPSPESSTEAAFVLGPVEFHKLPGYIRQQIQDHLASRGVTVTEEGTIPEDQIGQLTGTPPRALVPEEAASLAPVAPPQPQPAPDPQPVLERSRILTALTPAPTSDDRRTLPFGPAPTADDRRLLNFGPPPGDGHDRLGGLVHRGHDPVSHLNDSGAPPGHSAVDAGGGQHPIPAGLVPLEAPQGLEHLAGRVFRSSAGIVVYDGWDHQMLQAASGIHGDGMSFIADLHGIDGVPRPGGQDLSPEQLVSLLKAGGWDGRQRIVLLACGTGGEESFAARAAALPELRAHGVEVIAPAAGDRVWQVVGEPDLLVAGAAWSDEHAMLLPDLARPGRWLSHQAEGDAVAVREVSVGEHGMPARDAGSGHRQSDAVGTGKHADLAGNASAHSPPGHWVSRGPDGGRIDQALLTAAGTELTNAGGLGPEVAHGGFGSLHNVPGHPDLLVKVALNSDGRDNAQLAREAANLHVLTRAGLPTAYRGLVHWQAPDGEQRTGILMDRVEPGSLSKALLSAGKFSGQRPSPGDLAYVTDRTVQELQAARKLCMDRYLNIEDIQFMVAADGSVRFIDPARLHDLHDLTKLSMTQRQRKLIMTQFESRMNRIIRGVQEIVRGRPQ